LFEPLHSTTAGNATATFCERVALLTEHAHSLLRARCSAQRSDTAGWAVVSSTDANEPTAATTVRRSPSGLPAAPLRLLPTNFVNDREGERTFDRAIVRGGVCCDADGRLMVAVGACSRVGGMGAGASEGPGLCAGQIVTVQNPAASVNAFGTRSKYPVAQVEIKYPPITQNTHTHARAHAHIHYTRTHVPSTPPCRAAACLGRGVIVLQSRDRLGSP
jgi:hypothetical protein